MATSRKNPQESVIDAAVFRAATLSAAGVTQDRIAAELGVSASTVSRWKQRPDFQAVRNSILREACDAAGARLRALAVSAVDLIGDTMNDPQASRCDRLRAAGMVLDRVLGDAANESRIGLTDEAELQKRADAKKVMDDVDASFDSMMQSWM